MPKISVIMPVYNGAEYLEKSIGSLVNQTLDDIEIICINDCSTDSSLEILQDYAKNDTRIKIINSKVNQGQSKSKNLALDNYVTGEYVMFLDQDDWYELNACELCYNQAKNNQNDLILFDFNNFFVETNIFKKNNYIIDAFKDCLNDSRIRLYELKNNFIRSGYAWCYCYNFSFIQQYKIRFPEQNRFTDDVPFYINSIVNADTISIIDKALYNYRINHASITFTRPDLWYELFDARMQGYNYILKSKHANNFIYPFLIYFIRSIMYWYRRYSLNKFMYTKSYYNKMRILFVKFNNEHDISKISQYINYQEFRNIINRPYWMMKLTQIPQKIFSLRNSDDKTHKIITILGIKLSIKK